MIDAKLLAALFRNESTIDMLDFSHQGMTDFDVNLVCTALARNTHVNTLLFRSNRITDQGANKIIELLKTNHFIERLELARNSKISDACINNMQQAFNDRFTGKKGLRYLSLNPHRNMKTIAEVETISPDDFKNDYYLKSQPVLVRKAMIQSEAVNKWSLQYFNEIMGDKEVNLMLHNLEDGTRHYFSKMHSFYVKMHQAISLIQEPASANSLSTRVYLQQVPLNEFPEIIHDIDLPNFAKTIDHTSIIKNLWMGQKDTYSPLHFDSSNNLFIQIIGEKTLLLYPPEDSAFLFQHHPKQKQLYSGEHLSKISNIDIIDEYYDVARRATPYQVKVEPGDVLFIPKGWWHEVRSSFKPAISVNFWFKDQKKSIPEIERLLQNLSDDKAAIEIINQCVSLLIKESNPNYMTDSFHTLLQIALLFNAIDAAKLLLSQPDIEPNKTDISNAFTPFFMSIKFGQLELAELFIKRDDVSISDSFHTGYTPLTLAAEEGQAPIVKLLLKAGADPSKRDFIGQSPLELALINGQSECVALLKDHCSVGNMLLID